MLRLLLLSAILAPLQTRAGFGGSVVVSVYGGTPTVAGGVDGPLTAGALFTNPQEIKPFPSANMWFVLDQSTNRVRFMNATHVVRSVGSGASGNVPGVGTNAQISGPSALCVDPTGTGTLYLAEYGGHRIKAIDIVTATVFPTLAGSGAASYTDGIGTNAAFKNPYGVAVVPNTTLYVGDQVNFRIRAIDLSTRAVTTIAGSGAAASAGAREAGGGRGWRFTLPVLLLKCVCFAFHETAKRPLPPPFPPRRNRHERCF